MIGVKCSYIQSTINIRHKSFWVSNTYHERIILVRYFLINWYSIRSCSIDWKILVGVESAICHFGGIWSCCCISGCCCIGSGSGGICSSCGICSCGVWSCGVWSCIFCSIYWWLIVIFGTVAWNTNKNKYNKI